MSNNSKLIEKDSYWYKMEYLDITGDLLPFTVFVLSQGFLVSSVKHRKNKNYCLPFVV